MTTVDEIEAHLGSALPDALRRFYRKTDGEPENTLPYRLMTAAEIGAVPFDGEGAYLDHAPERDLMKAIGMRLWPIWTNDNSDHLALITAGPLSGMVATVYHDEESFFPVFRDSASTLKAIKRARRDGVEAGFQFPPKRKQKTTADADWMRVTDFAAALRGKPLGDGDRWAAQCIQNLAPRSHGKQASAVLNTLGLAQHDSLLYDQLRIASYKGNLAEVREITALGLDNTLLYDVLQTAAQSGRTKVVKILLEHGAPTDQRGDWVSPLGLAAKYGHTAIIELLLAAGADLQPDWAVYPLAHATWWRVRVSALLQLLAAGADINARSGEEQTTALHEACNAMHSMETVQEQIKVVRFLLENGADPNVKNGEGLTAFAYCKATSPGGAKCRWHRRYPVQGWVQKSVPVDPEWFSLYDDLQDLLRTDETPPEFEEE